MDRNRNGRLQEHFNAASGQGPAYKRAYRETEDRKRKDFFEACERQDAKAAEAILDEVTVKIAERWINSADGNKKGIHYFINDNFLPLVEKMLAGGFSPDARNDIGSTPLMMAAKEHARKVVDLLLKYNADTRAVNSNKISALHICGWYGRTNIVESICRAKKKPDVDARDIDDVTPLMMAAQRGYRDTACLLMDYGAERRLRAANGAMATDFAEQSDFADLAKTIRSYQSQPLPSPSLVVLFCQKGDFAGALAMIKKDPKYLVDSETEIGTTPLMIAAKAGNSGVVRELLALGAKVDHKNKSKVTALHCAAAEGHEDVCRVLFEAGALADVLDEDEYSPSDYARENGFTTLVDLIERHGTPEEPTIDEMVADFQEAAQKSIERIQTVEPAKPAGGKKIADLAKRMRKAGLTG